MPQLFVNSVLVSEDAGSAVVTLRLSSPADTSMLVNWTTVSGTAVQYQNGDYTGGTGSVTFGVGESLKTITIPITNDLLAESTEGFWVNLSLPAASPITLQNNRVLVSVLDNDASGASPVASIGSVFVDEASGLATFAVTLDRTSTGSVTVNYATGDLSAQAGTDYTATSGTLTFPVGSRVQTVSVPVARDATTEGVEAFVVTLSSPSGATLADAVGTGVLWQNGAAPVLKPTVWAADAVATEGVPWIEFPVWLDAPSSSPVSISYNLVAASADSYQYADYALNPGMLTFAAGQTFQMVRVPLTNDAIAEKPECFWLTLDVASGSSATMGRASALGTIIDNDQTVGTPIVTIVGGDVDERSGMAAFTILLDGPSAGTVLVPWATVDGTAVGGTDFTSRSGTVGFAPGETAKTVFVPLIDDATQERAEQFAVRLGTPTGATLAGDRAVVTIGANDAAAVLKPTLFVDDVTVNEGDTFAEMVLRLDAPSSGVVAVTYSSTVSLADSYQYADYVGVSGTLSFAPGQTVHTVRIPITNDAVAENVENFFFTVSAASGSSPVTLSRSSAMVSIVDNDPGLLTGTPLASVASLAVDETSAGYARFVVTLDRPATSPVSVHYQTVDGTALAGTDYLAASGTLVFAPGDTMQTVQVAVLDDATAEPAEQFRLQLDTPSGVTLAVDAGVATIGANDAASVLKPTLYVDDAIVGEADGYADMVLRLDAPSSGVITITYATVEALAKSYQSADYVTSYGTLSFAPGQTVQTVRVPITNDAVTENPESFFFTTSVASGSSAVTLARDAALVNIVDNDPASLTGTPVATVTDVTVDEQSGGFARFTVTLDRPASTPVTVQYATVDGTALAGADYLAASGTLVFGPGDTSQTISVALVDDAVQEAAEQFRLQLSLPSGATLASDWAVATIGANDAAALAKPTLSIDDVVVGEADGYAELVLRLNAPSAGVVAVNYSTSEALAKSYQFADFVPVSGTVSFAPGQTVQTVRVPIVDDAVNESVESFFFRINLASGSSAVTLGRDSATVSIVDNDPAVLAGTPTVSVADVVVDETTGGFARFTVTLDRPASTAVSVHYQTADGTALAGQDYLSASGTLVFAPGDTAQTLLVAIPDDATRESVEQFQLRLDTPVGATLGQSVARATLDANDAPALLTPTLSVEDVTAGEGDGYLDVLLRLDAPSAGVVAVNYSTVESQATGYSYADYASMSGTVSFAPGQTLQTVRIPIVNDALTEDTESFFFRVNVASGSAAVSLARGAATLTIVDNDPAVLAGTPFVSVRDVVVDESAGYARFAVVLDRPAAAQASVAYTTADRTAVAGQDYLATSGTLVFAAGETAKTVLVPIVDDVTQESFEQFVLSLSSPSGLVLGDAQGRATIGFSDQAAVLSPKLSVSDMVAGEIDGTGRFTLWLDAPSASPITINYSSGSTSPTSAISGTDFESVSSSVTFAPGTTTATVSVPVDEDANVEGNETFRLNLSVGGGSSVSLVRTQATGTIVDNDSSVIVGIPAVSIGSTSLSEHDSLATFNVTLDRAAVGRVTVNYTTVDGTALAGRDYRSASGVVTFLPGETAKTVQVSVIDDSARESDEQFSIVLSAPVGMTIAGGTGTGTILNDDANGAPTAADASLSTPEDIPLSGALPAATDPEGDPVTYARVSGPAHGTLSVLADGSYTYTPAANYSGADAFSYSVTDNLSASSTYNVSLTVTAVNDAPTVANPIPDQSATAGSAMAFAFAANTFADVDSATLTYGATLASGAALPAWLNFDPLTRRFSGTPGAGDAGSLSVKVTASDGSLSASDTFVLTVGAAANVPPVASNGSASTAEDVALVWSLPPATDANADPIAYAKASDPAHGTVTVAANGAFTYTPAANWNGTDSFGYTVSDGRGGSSTYSMSVTVTPVNDAPVVANPIPDQSASAGSTTAFAFAANTFNDVDGPALSYGATLADGSTLPAWLSFNPATRTFSGTPQAADAGTLSVKVTASDGALSVSDTFALSVGAVAGIAVSGTAGRDTLSGTAGNDTISGFSGNDLITGLAGNDRIDGGDGIDTARYDVPRALATIALQQTTSPYSATVSVPGLGTDTLVNVERLRFSDLAVAFDVTPTGNVDDPITKGIGGNGGKTYRLYQAAFARTPDLGGLGYWIDQVDQGATLFNIASGFLGSPEFKSKYGASPTNQEYTRALYLNVLHREPDATGYAYWNALLDGKPYNGVDYGSTTRQQMLVDFSEGNENKANVIEIIGNGFDYQPWS